MQAFSLQLLTYEIRNGNSFEILEGKFENRTRTRIKYNNRLLQSCLFICLLSLMIIKLNIVLVNAFSILYDLEQQQKMSHSTSVM
jgi:hypothetical protein